ncbi:MAG: rod shape-determining protein MreC [Saprospiraceae bacterium]
MRNLIFLLVKFGGVIAFLLLEFICFSLVVNKNQNQKAIFESNAESLLGAVDNRMDWAFSFVKMAEVADSLAAENARLRGELKNARFVNTILKDTTFNSDSLQQYTYTSARVTKNQVKRAYNYLRINRGSKHGISPHRGVIGAGVEGGIVGITIATSPYHTKVLSMLNRNSRISVEIKRNNEFGSLVWKGFDPRYFRMEDVPKYVQLQKGDTIQTSGYSDMFPSGLMVGTLDSFWLEPGSNIYGINVKLINDLRKTSYVYVVNDLMQNDIDTLEANSTLDE